MDIKNEQEKRKRDETGVPFIDTQLLNTLPGVHTNQTANRTTDKNEAISPPDPLVKSTASGRLIKPTTYETIARFNAVMHYAPSLKVYVCLVPMKAYIRIRSINPQNDVWHCELWDGEVGTSISIPAGTSLLVYIN